MLNKDYHINMHRLYFAQGGLLTGRRELKSSLHCAHQAFLAGRCITWRHTFFVAQRCPVSVSQWPW